MQIYLVNKNGDFTTLQQLIKTVCGSQKKIIRYKEGWLVALQLKEAKGLVISGYKVELLDSKKVSKTTINCLLAGKT